MLKLLKSLLGTTGNHPSARNLSGPGDLTCGDLIKFADSYGLPEGVRAETFKVQKVATYFYADEPCPQFVIKGASNAPLFLTIEDFDGEEFLVISKKLKHKEVEDVVGWNALKSSMNGGASGSLPTSPAQYDSRDSAWLAEAYEKRVGGGEGRYFEKDLRSSSSAPGGGESFKYHEYYSDDETKLLEVEVWDGDEYEVCVGLVRPFSDIAEYWPGTR
jgi:hypothetical protein